MSVVVHNFTLSSTITPGGTVATVQGTHNLCIALEVDEYTGNLGNGPDSNIGKAANQCRSHFSEMNKFRIRILLVNRFCNGFSENLSNPRGSHLYCLTNLYESRPDVVVDEHGRVSDMNSALEKRFEWFSKLSQLGERAYQICKPPSAHVWLDPLQMCIC